MWHLCHKCHICHIVFIEAQVAPKARSRNTRGQGKSNIPEGGFPQVERLFGLWAILRRARTSGGTSRRAELPRTRRPPPPRPAKGRRGSPLCAPDRPAVPRSPPRR